MKRPMKLLDIACMPNLNPKVTDGLYSVSEGKIYWTDENYVTCREHGACLCVNKDRSIWRCPACHEGAYVIWDDENEDENESFLSRWEKVIKSIKFEER